MSKIYYVSPSFFPAIKYGGPIYSALYTCEELAKLGLIINVCTTNSNIDCRLKVKVNVFIEYQPNFLIKYYNDTVIGIFSFSMLINLWRDIKKAEIVHIQAIFNSSVPIALFYACFFNKPVILTPRGALSRWGIKNKRMLWKKIWINFFIKPFSAKINWHVTSNFEKNDIKFFFPKAKVSFIPNGIHFNSKTIVQEKTFFNRLTKTSRYYSPFLISMGRLHNVKGFDILIEAFSKIRVKFPNAALFIAGEDEGELLNLQKQIRLLQLEDCIFFVGNIIDEVKDKFFANADLFVLPSHTENFGNVYAEALAAGTPIVASTNTPWEEVEAAGCGRWVPNTVVATTEAMVDLLSRDREQLRQNALKYVQKYDWKNIAVQFKELYERVLNEHSSKKK